MSGLPPPKRLQVLHELPRDGQPLRVEAFNLVDAGAGVLGEGVNVDLAMGQHQPHTDRGMPQAIDAALRIGRGVVLQPRDGEQAPARYRQIAGQRSPLVNTCSHGLNGVRSNWNSNLHEKCLRLALVVKEC